MDTLRFCINCLHFRQSGGGGQFSPPVRLECHHPNAPRDPVVGTHALCHDQRRSALGCGESGSRYQRKPREVPQPPPNGTTGKHVSPLVGVVLMLLVVAAAALASWLW